MGTNVQATNRRRRERVRRSAVGLGAALFGVTLAGCPLSREADVGGEDASLPDVVELDAGIDAPLDAPVPTDAPPCTTNEDCQRVPWCEHRWRCDPEDAAADAQGCVDEGGPYECPEGYGCISAVRGCRCIDGDGDGVVPPACGGRDCNDADPMAPGPSPSRFDGCDGFDSDCDGVVDENPDVTLYRDADGDGQGTTASGVRVCSGEGLVRDSGDCDDDDPYRYFGAPEVCNRENDACTMEPAWSEDSDQDGYAPIGATCRDDVPGAFPRLDCQDFTRSIGPGRPEICNGLDDDCDPSTADGSAADNGCLPGHRCMDGGCGQVLSLGTWQYGACALLLDQTVRCWGGEPCPGGPTSESCFTPTVSFAGVRLASLNADADYALDALGVVHGRNDGPLTYLPAATVVGSGGQCVVRAADGRLFCNWSLAPLVAPSDIVQIGRSAFRTAGGGVWSLALSPAPLIAAGVVAMDLSGETVVMEDGTARRRVPGGSYEPVPGVVGATEVASHGSDFSWFLRGPENGVIREGASLRPLPGSAGARGIVAADGFACAIIPDGRVRCWTGPGARDPWTPLGLPLESPLVESRIVGPL